VDPSIQQMPFEVQVPAGTVFLAGDTRNNSVDSRLTTDALDHGAVREQDIDGLVVGTGTLFSPQKLTPTSVFTDAGLPGAPSTDSGYSLDKTFILAGAALFLLGVIGVITVSGLRVRSRPRS
jgi:signal peptidase I